MKETESRFAQEPRPLSRDHVSGSVENRTARRPCLFRCGPVLVVISVFLFASLPNQAGSQEASAAKNGSALYREAGVSLEQRIDDLMQRMTLARRSGSSICIPGRRI